jgi:hypothetical protein
MTGTRPRGVGGIPNVVRLTWRAGVSGASGRQHGQQGRSLAGAEQCFSESVHLRSLFMHGAGYLSPLHHPRLANHPDGETATERLSMAAGCRRHRAGGCLHGFR